MADQPTDSALPSHTRRPIWEFSGDNARVIAATACREPRLAVVDPEPPLTPSHVDSRFRSINGR
jgi:hypothetical protein